jgi:hypothetical protein
MEFCSSYDFCQLLHVHWFDIHNVFIAIAVSANEKYLSNRTGTRTKALVANIEVPQIDSKIVR